jgi:Ala-tRNA(Pro) deacylase
MATACKLEDYMTQHGIRFAVIRHPHSRSSMETAELAHVPGDRLAKSVIRRRCRVRDGGLPSTHHVQLGQLSRELNRTLRLAMEDELPALFADCEKGAIPPVGLAYGMTTIVDNSLAAQPEVYFEAGDHETLIRVTRDAFTELMEHAGTRSSPIASDPEEASGAPVDRSESPLCRGGAWPHVARPRGRMVIPAGLPESRQLDLVTKDRDGTIRMAEILPVRFGVLDGTETGTSGVS